LVTTSLRISNVSMGFCIFLDEVLFHDMVHIDDLFLLGDVQVTLGISSSCVACWPSYFKQTKLPSSFLFLLANFNKRVMLDIMGLGWWEFFYHPLARHQVQLPISFGEISLLSMEECAPFVFLGSWVLVALYLCFKFCIFKKPFLE
jgi:hypothetical protein